MRNLRDRPTSLQYSTEYAWFCGGRGRGRRSQGGRETHGTRTTRMPVPASSSNPPSRTLIEQPTSAPSSTWLRKTQREDSPTHKLSLSPSTSFPLSVWGAQSGAEPFQVRPQLSVEGELLHARLRQSDLLGHASREVHQRLRHTAAVQALLHTKPQAASHTQGRTDAQSHKGEGGVRRCRATSQMLSPAAAPTAR